MITVDQIEDWIREVEERPSSAALIIRYIANRLRELSSRNEELLADNIELRTGRKVEDFESRIANLEYQLDLLKRQISGEMSGYAPAQVLETISFIIYNRKGQALRAETTIAGLSSGSSILGFADPIPADLQPRLLVTLPTEELLFVFDSGRTVNFPVTDIPTAGTEKISWQGSFLAEPHGGEELVTILPIAKMTLFDYCIQVSRRGCAKKMMKTSFESHVGKSFVGAGVKGKPDKTCNLVLCGKDDQMVMISKDGFIWCLDVNQLPYTIEEVLKLSAIDYLVIGLAINPGRGIESSKRAERKQSIVILTQNGKAIHRETTWIEKAVTFKSRGQAIFSQARRDAGIRIVGAALIEEDRNDWGAVLGGDGNITVHQISDLLSTGSVPLGQSVEIMDFVPFTVPVAVKA